MMDHDNERFVELEEKMAKMWPKDRLDALGVVSVGDTFEQSGVTFRIRKIIGKDIICRPVKWNQDNEENEEKDEDAL